MSARVSDEEVDKWAEKRADDAGRLARDIVAYRAEIAALKADRDAGKATIAALVEALKPFVKMATEVDRGYQDRCPLGLAGMKHNDGTMTCVGDLRRAARAVADATAGTGAEGQAASAPAGAASP